MHSKRALILGHFSTVGDIECLRFVEAELRDKAIGYDTAAFGEKPRSALPGSLLPAAAEPKRYSHLIVICGPCFPELFRRARFDLDAWRHATRIGVNLNMIEPLEQWNPFDVLIERSSERALRADLAFLGTNQAAPVIGRCIIASQKEYGTRSRQGETIALIDDLLIVAAHPVIEIDTRWPLKSNRTGLASPEHVGALMSRCDAVVTNRLHGLVFALRHGVPTLAIDGIAGTDKLTAQAKIIGWPCCLSIDAATREKMADALLWCLTQEARAEALRTRDRAIGLLATMPDDLAAALATPPAGGRLSPAQGHASAGTFAMLRSLLRRKR